MTAQSYIQWSLPCLEQCHNSLAKFYALVNMEGNCFCKIGCWVACIVNFSCLEMCLGALCSRIFLTSRWTKHMHDLNMVVYVWFAIWQWDVSSANVPGSRRHRGFMVTRASTFKRRYLPWIIGHVSGVLHYKLAGMCVILSETGRNITEVEKRHQTLARHPLLCERLMHYWSRWIIERRSSILSFNKYAAPNHGGWRTAQCVFAPGHRFLHKRVRSYPVDIQGWGHTPWHTPCLCSRNESMILLTCLTKKWFILAFKNFVMQRDESFGVLIMEHGRNSEIL